MIIRTKDFKRCCQTILYAIDSKNESVFSSTLELKTNNNTLLLNVTNRDYYVSVSLPIDNQDTFRAAVNAQTFLQLISKLTTETIEMLVTNNSLNIIANGNYSIPMIYTDNTLLELPVIELSNEITNSQDIKAETLYSIVNYNSKELQRGSNGRAWSKYYYVDEQGAITCVTGACVNSFKLDKPVKLILDDQIVKLFKLFKFTDIISFRMSKEEVNGKIITKIELKTDSVLLVAKLVGMIDDTLMNTFPVAACRKLANNNYNFTTTINREELMAAISRLTLLNAEQQIGKLQFVFDGTKSVVIISDVHKINSETINLVEDFTTVVQKYETIINLKNLNSILTTCEETYITVCFGNHKTIIFKRDNISDILPEAN